MKHGFPIVLAATAWPLIASALPNKNDGKSGSDSPDICYPDFLGVLAPCQSIANIEESCQPKGTQPIDYEAHAQCMCKGSYFQDWIGCQKCLLVHGMRNDRENIYYNNVLAVASKGFCSGTPTTAFNAYFTSAQANTQAAPPVTTGNTASSDQFPGKSEISLYYTLSGSQGPGSVTGSAASAKPTTAAGSSTPSKSDSSIPTMTTKENGSTKTTQSPTSTTSNAASVPSNQAGLAMAIAAFALVAIA